MNDLGAMFWDSPNTINNPGSPNILFMYRDDQDNNYYVKKSDGTSELMFQGGSFTEGGLNVGTSNNLFGVNSIIAGVYNRTGGRSYPAVLVPAGSGFVWQIAINGDFTNDIQINEFVTVRDSNNVERYYPQVTAVTQVGPVTRVTFSERIGLVGSNITFTQDMYGNANLVVGQLNTNQANFSAVIGSGNENTQYANNSLNVGQGNKINNRNVLLSGEGGLSRWQGERILASKQYTPDKKGDTQVSEVMLSGLTEDTTPVNLTLPDGTLMLIPDKCVMSIKVVGNGIQTAVTSGGSAGDAQSYMMEELVIKRVAGVVSTINASTPVQHGNLGGTIAINTTGNSLNINVTPPNASPIKWNFHVTAVINTY